MGYDCDMENGARRNPEGDPELEAGGTAGDAIEGAIKEVEDFPYFKSVGYGGLPNEEMEVELDAAY